jgi:hypothetical protein
VHCRQQRRQDALRPNVCTVVAPGAVAKRQKCSVGRRGHLDLVHLLARVVGRDEVLVPVLDPLHRPANTARCKRDQVVLGIELAADPEGASDVHLDEPDRFDGKVEHLSEHRAVEVLYLRGAPHGETAGFGVELGDETARLHRDAGVPMHAQLAPHHHVCSLEESIDVAVAHRDARDDIAADLAMDRRSLLGVQHIDNWVELIEVEADELRGVFRSERARRNDQCDRLSDVPHDVVGKRRLQDLVRLRRLGKRQPDRDA